MFDYLKGELASKTPTEVVIDVGGVGYRADVSLRTSDRLPPTGRSVKLLVHHKVQEDRQRLFGFADEIERDLFRDLIAVAGVGPAHSLALLSGLDPERIWELIRDGDAKALSRTKGIGPKIAQRVCTELADKAGRRTTSGATMVGTDVPPVMDDAVSALLVLGYNESQAHKAVTRAIKNSGGDVEVQEVIREALQGS